MKYVIAIDKKGNIITCPKDSLKDEPWIFDGKPFVVCKITIKNCTSYRAVDVANRLHELYLACPPEFHHKKVEWNQKTRRIRFYF